MKYGGIMRNLNRIAAFMAGASLAFMTAVSAEDIDLFLNAGGDDAVPNVLFMVDNSANWSSDIGGITQETMNRNALQEVLVNDTSLLNQLRIGLLPFSNGNSPRGSKVLSHVRLLDTTYQSELGWILDKANENSDGALRKTNNAPYAMSLHEALKYYAGDLPHSGIQDGDHDAAAVNADGTYNSPAAEGCGKNYVVVLGNGEPDSGEDNPAEEKLRDLGGVQNDDPISLDPSIFESNWSDEFARYMANNEVVPEAIREGRRDVITYVIDVFDPNQNETRKFLSARAWMRSIARWGNGRYFAAHSEADIKTALTKITDELLAVNSVFAASTLPVSVNVRGTNLNQVYMGVFRPDAENRTRWMGNLKLYQLAVDEDTNTLYLADKNGDRAQSASTGFIVNTAVSFWTTESDFWNFKPRGTPVSGSDMPDGEVVEKGAVSQRLRDVYNFDIPNRNVYTCTGTCSSGSNLADTPFVTTNTDISFPDYLGDRDTLIEWVRGVNNSTDSTDDDYDQDKTLFDIRPSIHGDVLHSRPAVINRINDAGVEEVIVFYGSNDGQLRAVLGGKDDTKGTELWSFVPEESFASLGDLRENTSGKQYFPDGSIGVLHDRAGVNGATEDRIWLYLSMRRGGRFIYALDVTQPTTPKLLWRKSHNDTGWEELGQSWSMPTATRIDLNGTTTPVVIFGAGYDAPVEDTEPRDNSLRSMGRGIFVVNAQTGALIWQAGPSPTGADVNKTVTSMQYSMPADPTVLDRNRNGLADRIYQADTGGNIWRMDISDPDPNNWAVHHFASLGEDQRFLYRPDVVYAEDNDPQYDAVLIGAGNREDPFDTSVVNHFYMIKDRAIGSTGGSYPPYTRADLYDATDNLVQDGTETEQADAKEALETSSGWFIRLENAGEKVVSGATTVNGTTFFNTNEPPDLTADDCVSSLGIARNYLVDFSDGSATSGDTKADRSKQAIGGGFPPSPVPVVVEIDGRYYEAVISGTEVKIAPGPPLDTRFRIWWNKNLDS